jgi:hypothetical protein
MNTLDLSSCKIGDNGAIALVSAIGNNEKTTIRKLRVRDNYITGTYVYVRVCVWASSICIFMFMCVCAGFFTAPQAPRVSLSLTLCTATRASPLLTSVATKSTTCG